MAGAVSASPLVLSLNESNIKNGTIAESGTVYSILSDIVDYVDYDGIKISYRRIIVENLSEIEALSSRIRSLGLEIKALDEKIANQKILVYNLDKNGAASLGTLKMLEDQSNALKEGIAELRKNETALQNTIAGNTILSQSDFRIAVGVFIIILVAAVIMKSREALAKDE
jgi:SMC interacting uncharacterized protein involved in chromosome segregation